MQRRLTTLGATLVASLGVIAFGAGMMPAVGAPYDPAFPHWDSIGLTDPGPFETGDVVHIAYSAHNDGDQGLNRIQIFLADSQNDVFSETVQFDGVQNAVSGVIDIPLTSDWAPGTVVARQVDVYNNDIGGSDSAAYTFGFGIGSPATFNHPTPPTVADSSGKEVFSANIGDDLAVIDDYDQFRTWGGPRPTSFSYQWTRSGMPIPGETGQTYRITSIDAGSYIGVVSTARRAGYADLVGDSSNLGVSVPYSQYSAVGQVSISGNPTVGDTITAVPDGWLPMPSGYQYDWLRNGQPITSYLNAPEGSYVVQQADIGAAISVSVAPVLTGYDGPAVVSAPVTGTPVVVTPPEPAPTSVPVYRFYNPNNGTHFFTMDVNERNSLVLHSGLHYESVAYAAFSSQAPGTIPLYRFFFPNVSDHFYTTSAPERDNIIRTFPASAMSYEGIAYYIYPITPVVADTVTVARFYSPDSGTHFFTANAAERDHIIQTFPAHSLTYEQNEFRVPAVIPADTNPPPVPPVVTPPVVTPPPVTQPANPGDTKNCSDFSTYAAAKAWFDLYYPYYGDVARLDQNNDRIPCESLPGHP